MKLPFTQITLTKKQVLIAAGVIVFCVLLAFFYKQIDMQALHDRAERLSGPAVFGLLAVLPLIGFPVTILHVIVGARFGPWVGVGLVAAATLFHLVASFLLVKTLPHIFAPKLESIRRRIPRGAHAPVTLFTLLLPGVPYWGVNYVLPLVGVRFWIFLGIAWPMHVARSMVSIYVGDVSGNLTPARIAVVALYWVVILTGVSLSWRALKKRLGDQPPVASDPTPLA